MGADGKPLKGKNGRPILDWHKASVEDAAAALVETTGGDKVMARDTATDLVKNEQARLEKIRKQKPKGDDPIEIAESRVAIRKQEEEQQAIIKHWKDVNQLIQQQMREEQEQAVREREAAKSEAQRQREAEEARIRQEQQDEQDRQRLREQIEKDKKLRNQEYQPLTQAKKELAGDSDALSVLDDVEPRGLDEWVSYLLRPHSILWKDASDAETGLQTELGLKRGDLQRMMSVVGTSESGAQPFNKIVMEIHEGLPDAMKEQYTDQDVRNTLLGLFAEGSSARMLHLTEEHRIEEAREMMKENERRDAEAELDAWAEFYHLTPEEREDFEDWLQLPPTEPEQEVINNIIAEHAERQSNGTSPSVGEQPVSGGIPAGVGGGEGQVQGPVEAEGNGNNAETVEEGAEAGSGEPAVSDDQVAGGTQGVVIAPSEQLKPTDLRDAIRVESPEIGVAEANAKTRYLLSATEKDAEGNSFYEKDGSIDLWTRPELFTKAGRQSAPIRLTSRNLQHILDEHHKEIGSEQDVFDFLDDIFNNAPVLRKARGRGMFVVVEQDNTDKAAIIKLMPSKAGDYYNVETAGYYRKNKWKDYEDVIADLREPGQSDAATDVSKPQTPNENGRKPINAETQASSSEGKDTNNSSNIQEKTEKSSQEPQNSTSVKRTETPEAFKKEVEKEKSRAISPKRWLNPEEMKQRADEIATAIRSLGYYADISHSKNSVGNSYYIKISDKDFYPLAKLRISDHSVTNTNRVLNEYHVYPHTSINEILKDIFGEPKRLVSDDRMEELKKQHPNMFAGDLFAEQEEAQPIGKTSSPEEIAQEEAKVDTNPTEGQKEAGNYQKGHINVDGYDITIENPKGSVRSGVDSKGNRWKTTMHNTYGYIRGTEGVDGDHIDVFLSDNPASGSVFVVDQVNPESGAFDEHKVMYGFASEEEAREAYLSNYSEGWQGLGAITEVSREEFAKWIKSSHRKTKPFAEYKSVKKEQPAADATGPVAKGKKEKPMREHKRLVSDEKMEELRKQLLAKMNNANVGIDPERMLLGAMYAVGKIERGFTKFADYAQEMVNDLGDMIRPYLKSFYNAVRDMPEAQEYADQMDDYDTVQKFDVFNFDKGGKVPTVFEKAEQVAKEQKVKRDAKKVKQQQPDLFAGDLFGGTQETVEKPAATVTKPQKVTEVKKESTDKPVRSNQPKLRPATEEDLESEHPIVYLDGHPWNIIAVMRSGEQISATEFSKPKVDSVMLTNGKSVKLEDLMVEDDMPALDKNDYRTYMTPAAREYFAKDPRFAKYAHKELAFIQAAVWDEVIIPVEELKKEPAIIEAEARINAKKGNLQLTEDEVLQYAERLFDKEHGSASYRDGELLGYTGDVKAEKKAFIVVGRPAGGKSSVFADPISHKYSARIIDSDTVKPWLDGYDDGYGANYVHKASTIVAERALDMAIERGENVVIPRIGGLSVVERAIELRKKGYDVELLFNDVPEEASIMRAASRFAMKGRYLSLDYLTTIGDKVSIIFSNFVDRNIGDYERIKDEVQRLLGRSERLPGNSASTREGLRELRTDVPAGEGSTNKDVQELVGDGQLRSPEKQLVVNDDSPIFTHAEWKDNNVPFGTKSVTLWNSNDETFEDFLTKKHDDARNLQQVGEENRRGSDRVSSRESSVSGSANNSGLESDIQERRDERQGDTGVSQSDAEVSGSSAGQLRRVQGLTQQQPAKPKQAPKHNNKRNNSGERGKDYAPTSPKARFNANVAAIKMMRELIDQGIEAPTKDQMEVLRQYSGWGGLGTFFNDESSAENKILRDLLDDEEYNAATLSIKTAYYTPAYIIDSLWDIAKAMGFKGGNVLEGSAGIGNIIQQMPKDMCRQSDIEAVEIDKISGNILKLLYPDAKVHIQGFQDTVIRNGSVDLAITNVPFAADLSVIDKVVIC